MYKINLLNKFYLTISLLMLIPLLYFGIYSAEKEKEYHLLVVTNELTGIAALIERHITVDFDEILLRENAAQLTESEQALTLNKYLQPAIDEVAVMYPGYGIGIASRDLIRRVALSPGLSREAIVEPALHHKESKVYKYGEPDVFQVNSANWDNKKTLVATYPVYQKGKLVGHTWANTKMEDMGLLYIKSVQRWLLFSLFSWITLMLVIAFFFKRFNASISRLITQIIHQDDERKSLADMPQLLPILDTVIRLRHDYRGEVNKLKLLIDACPAAIAVVDRRGIITAYNELYDVHVKECFGHYENLIGVSMIQLVAKTGIPVEHMVVTRILEGKTIIQEQKFMCGRECLISAAPLIEDETGEITGGILLLNDITERENLRREVARLDRLTVIGEMAASVAHEIRNPMTSVRGYLQFMALKAEDKDRYTILIDELDRANAIIDDFLSLARNRTVPKMFCQINKIISCLQPILYAATVNSGCILELDLQQGLPELFLSEKEIKQLIINLCRNAQEAMQSNGHLTIRTKREGDYVHLEIEDNGCGIPQDHMEKVIEPFYTTKGNGTGLGLSICQSIAEQHNADLTVASHEGVGTTVTIKFPVPPENE